jgi:hypothetical protein
MGEKYEFEEDEGVWEENMLGEMDAKINKKDDGRSKTSFCFHVCPLTVLLRNSALSKNWQFPHDFSL